MKKQAVAEYYCCIKCHEDLKGTVKVLNDLYYCYECFDAELRRNRLRQAEKEFDESQDETVE